MNMDMKEIFVEKLCTVLLFNRRVLDGVIVDADDNGFILKTKDMTSYVSWNERLSVKPKTVN